MPDQGGRGQSSGFARWLRENGYSATTRKGYLGVVRRAEEFLGERGLPPLRQASTDHLLRWYGALPKSYASRSAARNAVQAYWLYLGRRNFPRKALRLPRRPEMICRAVSEEDCQRILAAAPHFGPSITAAVYLGYYAALRREEIAGLMWSDIRGSELHVVGKYEVDATLPVHPKLGEALDALRQSREPEIPWVFPGRYPGTHVSPATVWLWIRLVGTKAGVDGLRPHQLRHTALATMNDRTGDLRTTQALARHKDPKVTAGYTRISRQRLLDAMGTL